MLRNNKVIDALLSYHNLVRSLSVYIEQREESLIFIMYPSMDKLFDNRVFQKMLNGLSFNRPEGNPQLLTTDKAVINEYSNRFILFKMQIYILFITLHCWYTMHVKHLTSYKMNISCKKIIL